MKTLLIIVCALTVTVASAATVPSIGGGLRPPAQVEAVARPEPAALQVNWWRYFDAEGEALAQRIRETNERLETLLRELPEEMAQAARPLVESLKINLDALAQAKAQPSSKPLPPPVYPRQYTIPQLMHVIGRLHDLQAELPAAYDEVASSETAVRAASQAVDTRMAAYLNLPPTEPERVLRGLEIMADWAAVAVARERLRVRRAALAVQEIGVERLAEERNLAVTRLVVEDGELEALSREIAQAESNLQQARERTAQEQTTLLSVAADKAKKTRLPYHRQRIINTQVAEAIALVRLIRLQAQHQLALLLSDVTDMDTRALREQLAYWHARLAEVRRDAAGWTQDSQQERNRAAEAMASGATLSEGAVPLFGMLYGDRLALAQQTLIALERLQDTIAQIEVFIRIVDEELARQEGGLRDWLARSEITLRHLWDITTEWASQSLFKIGDTPVTMLGLLRVAFILFVAWWVSYWFRRVLTRLSRGYEAITQSVLYTIGRLFHYGIIALGFIIGLASIGVDFTNFALVAGAIGIGIGFGLQSIVNNFVSGLILLFERTLKVGDFIELGSGVAGEVRAINVRSTLINTNDNVDIVVPNSKFINDNVINWTLLEANCRIHVRFKVPYGTDVDRVTQAGLEAADRVPFTLRERKPNVWLVEFGDSSFEFALVVWITPQAVKRPAAVHAAYNYEIAMALRQHGIEIPVPQREIRLHPDLKGIFQIHPGSPPNRQET